MSHKENYRAELDSLKQNTVGKRARQKQPLSIVETLKHDCHSAYRIISCVSCDSSKQVYVILRIQLCEAFPNDKGK